MTEIAIQAQIDAIKRATEKALQSKEASIAFLVRAGIIKNPEPASLDLSSDRKK